MPNSQRCVLAKRHIHGGFILCIVGRRHLSGDMVREHRGSILVDEQLPNIAVLIATKLGHKYNVALGNLRDGKRGAVDGCGREKCVSNVFQY